MPPAKKKVTKRAPPPPPAKPAPKRAPVPFARNRFGAMVVGADVGPPAPAAPSQASTPTPAHQNVVATPVVTWPTWYNTVATAEEQRWFDSAASVIDNGGQVYQRGGGYENYVDIYQDKGTAFYNALVNYRDTGGRRALLPVPLKDYGKVPISTVKNGGPIERTPAGYVLHPGRYSYTAVYDNMPAFEAWLAAQKKSDLIIGQMQTSPGLVPGLMDPYYRDYEMTVLTDISWPTTFNGSPLIGVPTWVPPSINIIDYWGKVTSISPDWDWIPRALNASEDFAKGVLMLGTVIGISYILSQLRPTPRERVLVEENPRNP